MLKRRLLDWLHQLPCHYRHDWKIHKNGTTLWFHCERCHKRGWSNR